MLTKQRVNKRLPEYQEIKELMKRSFPENELYSMWFLMLISRIKKVDFLAYYDNNNFIGYTYIIQSKKVAYIMYLAVNDKLYSKGYGSQILQDIITTNKDKSIVLDIEPIDEKCNNQEQRKKRYKFYLKNGFKETGYFVEDIEDGSDYLILSTTGNFPKQECEKLLRGLSYGTYKRRYQNKKLKKNNQ